MKANYRTTCVFFEEQGAIAIMVALLAPLLLGFAAFAVDLPNLMVAKNELQNAADAGALAGARFLYIGENGSMVNAGADAIASSAAVANFSQKAAVEVESVERGHWSFATRIFTPNSSLDQVDLWNTTTEELDANLNFINAVRVNVRRSATPVASFFARIFGREGFAISAEATAFIGFAGTLQPWEYDMPITVCLQSIVENGVYTCNIGRMLNSSGNAATSNTAAWTNFSQPCNTANASEMSNILKTACEGNGANEDPVVFGQGIGATGGVQDNVLRKLADCWTVGRNDGSPIDTDGDGAPDQPWELVLPVIDCPGNNVSNCSEVRGAVTVKVVWILEKESDPAPLKMGAWDNSNVPDDATRWNNFVQYFNLKNADGQPAPKAKKSIYFLPDCTPHEPAGTTGGENYGILAEIPVLVK